MTSRRTLLRIIPIAALATLASRPSFAADVDPKDAQAAALGYIPDASKVDKSKFPKYAAGQTCESCQLYQSKPGATSGPCAIFPGKSVAAKGWCSAYVKKA
ncbi:MAG: hypothetical protein EOP36_15755 [Rubrivivax sp.]|nr:MAG: hypothetical protein EOP36_15755 [Rubrivivax sp.]